MIPSKSQAGPGNVSFVWKSAGRMRATHLFFGPTSHTVRHTPSVRIPPMKGVALTTHRNYHIAEICSATQQKAATQIRLLFMPERPQPVTVDRQQYPKSVANESPTPVPANRCYDSASGPNPGV